jgi:hypothetical protein
MCETSISFYETTRRDTFILAAVMTWDLNQQGVIPVSESLFKFRKFPFAGSVGFRVPSHVARPVSNRRPCRGNRAFELKLLSRPVIVAVRHSSLDAGSIVAATRRTAAAVSYRLTLVSTSAVSCPVCCCCRHKDIPFKLNERDRKNGE